MGRYGEERDKELRAVMGSRPISRVFVPATISALATFGVVVADEMGDRDALAMLLQAFVSSWVVVLLVVAILGPLSQTSVLVSSDKKFVFIVAATTSFAAAFFAALPSGHNSGTPGLIHGLFLGLLIVIVTTGVTALVFRVISI